MALTIGDALLKLGCDTSGLTKGLHDAQTQMKTASDKLVATAKQEAADCEKYFEQLGKAKAEALKKVSIAAVAIGGAILGAAALAIKSYAEEEQSISKLRQAMANMGLSYDDQKQSIESVIASQLKLGFSLKEQRDSLSRLILGTHDVAKAQDLMGMAMDIARGKGVDLASASQAVSQALAGNWRGLQQFVPAIKDAATEEEKWALARQAFAGQSEAYSKTLQGQMEALKISMGELADTVGGLLAPAMKGLIDFITPIITKVKEWIEANPELAKVIGIAVVAIGGLLLILGTLGLLLPTLATGFAAFGLAMTVATGPIGLAVIAATALVAAGIAIWKNWGKIGDFFKDIGRDIKEAFTGGGDAPKVLTDYLEKQNITITQGIAKWGSYANLMFAANRAQKDLTKTTDTFVGSMSDLGDMTFTTADAIEKYLGVTEDAAEVTDDFIKKLTQYNTEAKRRAEEAAQAEIDAIDDKIKAENEALKTLLDNLETYYKAEKDATKKVAEDAIDAIDDRMDAERKAHDRRMSDLEVEYRAIRDNLDAQLDIALGAYQDQIDLINDQLDAEKKALQDSLNAEKIAGFESGILNATTAEEKKRVQDELNAFLAELARERHRQELEDQIATIRDQMDLARQQAKDAQDLAAASYEAKKLLEEQALTDTIGNLNTEKEAVQDALQVKLDGYDTDYNKAVAIEQAKHDNLIAGLEAEKVLREAALTAQLHQYDLDIAAFDENIRLKLLSTAEFVRQYNALIAQMGQMPAPIVPGGPPVYVPGEGGGIIWTPPPVDYVPPGYEPPTQYATGGLIPEPTLLYGLKSQKAYAIAGEAGPERVSPMGAGGASNITNTNNINIASLVVREQADVERIAQELYRLERLRGFAYGRS
jgi:hypothetical protein